jgi:hypothetical protein
MMCDRSSTRCHPHRTCRPVPGLQEKARKWGLGGRKLRQIVSVERHVRGKANLYVPKKLKSQFVHVDTAFAFARVMIGLISAGYLFIIIKVVISLCLSQFTSHFIRPQEEALIMLFVPFPNTEKKRDMLQLVVVVKNSQPWKRQPRSAEASDVREEGDAGADGGGLGVRDEGAEGEDHRQALADRSPEEQLTAAHALDEEP